MIYFHERILPTSAEVEPATSWSPVQLSHRSRYQEEEETDKTKQAQIEQTYEKN